MRRPNRKPRLHIAFGLSLLVGCAQEAASTNTPSADALRDEAPSGDRAPTDVSFAALGTGNRAFAFDLYQQLAKTNAGKNLVFSPYSISSALALTYAGARDGTAAEMKSALHFDLPPASLHASFGATAAQLTARGRDQVGADGTPFRLNIGNAVWAQQGHPFEPAFLEVAKSSYGAEPVSLDFQGAPEPSRATINARIAKDTEQLIEELLPQGSITTNTRLVLTNTVYFNASWRVKFSERETRDAPFTKLDGTQVNTKLMNEELYVPYGRGPNYQAVALPYASADLSFVAVLPDAGKFAEVEASASQVWFDTVRANLRDARLHVGVPKLDFRARASLPETLQALGMKAPFTDDANFSGLSSVPLAITDVVHEAVIKVFEGGTIAAAATGVVAGVTSVREPPPRLTLDRPFLFAIVDAPTGQVLFLGRVTDPTAK